MKKITRDLLVAIALLSLSAVVFSGCASSSYSKDFDEAD